MVTLVLSVVLTWMFLTLIGVAVYKLRESYKKMWRITVRHHYRQDNLAKRFRTETVTDKQLSDEWARLNALDYPHHTVNARSKRLIHRALMTRYPETYQWKYMWVDKEEHPMVYLFRYLQEHPKGKSFEKEYWARDYSETQLRFYTLLGMLFFPIAILHSYLLSAIVHVEFRYWHRLRPEPNATLDDLKTHKMDWIYDVQEYRKLCAPLGKRHDGLMYWGRKLKEDWMFFVSTNKSGDILSDANFIMVKKWIKEKVEADYSLEDQWDIESFSGNYDPEHIIIKIFDEELDPQRLKPLPLAVWAVEEVNKQLDGYPVLDEDLFSNMEEMDAYDDLYESGRHLIDTSKMPEGTDWDEMSLYYSGERDDYPNDQERPAWVYELYSTMYSAGYEGQYGDSGRCYDYDDVMECLYRLGWMDDDTLEEYEAEHGVSEKLIRKSDPENYEYEDREWAWANYFPESALSTTGDGKYYSLEYFEKHIQHPLI